MRRTDDNAVKSVQAAVFAALPGPRPGDEPWTVWRRAQGDVREPFAIVSAIAAPDVSTDDYFTPKVEVPVNVGVYLAERATAQEAHDAARHVRQRLTDAFLFGVGQPGPRRVRFFDWDDRMAVERYRVVEPTAAAEVVLTFEAGEVRLPLPLTPEVEQDAGEALRLLLDDDVSMARRTQLAFDLVLPDGVNPPAVTATGSLVEHRQIASAAPAPWRGDRDVLSIPEFGAQVVADQDEPTKAMVMVDLRCSFRRGVAVPSSQTYVRRVGARFDPME